MKKFYISVLLMIVMLAAGGYSAQAQSEIRMQSVFMYNFTRLIAWPADYQSGDFIVAVYGNSPMMAEVEDMASTKRAGNQPIVAKNFRSVEEISRCHILYIPSNQSRRIEEIVAALKANRINALVVTDARNAIRSGATINFTIIDGRQRFEMSQENARAMGLNPGGEITRLAILAD